MYPLQSKNYAQNNIIKQILRKKECSRWINNEPYTRHQGLCSYLYQNYCVTQCFQTNHERDHLSKTEAFELKHRVQCPSLCHYWVRDLRKSQVEREYFRWMNISKTVTIESPNWTKCILRWQLYLKHIYDLLLYHYEKCKYLQFTDKNIKKANTMNS